MATINRLLKECALGHGRIVSTCELTPEQIIEAQVRDHMYVTTAGLGYVLLPWDLHCKNDPMTAAEAIRKFDLIQRPPPGDGILRFE